MASFREKYPKTSTQVVAAKESHFRAEQVTESPVTAWVFSQLGQDGVIREMVFTDEEFKQFIMAYEMMNPLVNSISAMTTAFRKQFPPGMQKP